MRFYTVTFKIILMLVFVAGAQSSKLFHCAQHDSDSQKKFANPGFERLFTVAIAEPAGYTAACFATNIDSLSRIIVAEIFDWRATMLLKPVPVECLKVQALHASQRLNTAILLCAPL